jgi:hypothetical protein
MTWQINFTVDPLIHLDDAKKAIAAALDESRKNRLPRISEDVIVEDLFIASLANHRPWNQRQIEQIMKSSVNKNFCERFARALEKGRSPTFDKIDIFILRNWREPRFKPEIKALIEAQEGELPGLRDWSPLAVEGFFALGKIETDCRDGNFDDWFRKRRERLGLSGNAPYQIKKFIVKGEGIATTITIVR